MVRKTVATDCICRVLGTISGEISGLSDEGDLVEGTCVTICVAATGNGVQRHAFEHRTEFSTVRTAHCTDNMHIVTT